MIPKNNIDSFYSKNKFNLLIFLIPIVIFLSKWFFSFILFENEYFITKVLFDTPDSQYYPIVKSLSNLDFAPSFNSFIESEKLLTFPYGPIVWHALFYKIFGNISFLIIEFVFIFLFFYFFFKIFKLLGFSYSSSLLSSLLIIFLPNLSHLLINFNFSIPYLKDIDVALNHIFSTRFPRPQVTGLYFLVFIYFLMKFSENVNENFNIKFCFSFAVILGLLANSFFYFFLYALFTILILLIVEYKKKLFNILLSKSKIILFFLIIFVLIITPVFLQNLYGESDHARRIGLFSLGLKEKIYLNKFFLFSIFRIEPLILIILSTLLKIIINRYYNFSNLGKKLDSLYYLFVSSILVPFVFVSISPKAIALYHFADYIIANGILYLLISLLSILFFNVKKLSSEKVNKNKKFFEYFFVIIILLLFSFSNYKSLNSKDLRLDFNNMIEYLGGVDIAGGKLKECTEGYCPGSDYWSSPNLGATNEAGFSALPAGGRDYDSGYYNYLGEYASFWAYNHNDVNNTYQYLLRFSHHDFYKSCLTRWGLG